MRRLLRSQVDYRRTLWRNLLTSLILYESVITTKGKAKPFISFAARFLHRVAKGELAAKRLAGQTLLDRNAVAKLFEELLPRLNKTGVRIQTLAAKPRFGDNAPQVLITLLSPEKSKAESAVAKLSAPADGRPTKVNAPKMKNRAKPNADG